MVQLKEAAGFSALSEAYLFAETGKRILQAERALGHPVARLGIGDVSLPLTPAVCRALTDAAREMGEEQTRRGYAPAEGYAFLRKAAKEAYAAEGVSLSEEEIYVSDGAKGELSLIASLFSPDTLHLIPDPAYPAYRDISLFLGRKILFLPGREEERFLAKPPQKKVGPSLIFLTSPSNPTGEAYDDDGLLAWIDYAFATGSVLLFDGAYADFCGKGRPRSIFSLPGAESCCVEIRSFSKGAGFTGLRCGTTVIPEKVLFGNSQPLSTLYRRAINTLKNGVSYPAQRAAEAALSPAGRRETAATVAHYRQNAGLLRESLTAAGARFFGGWDAPYLFLQAPGGRSGWNLFDILLRAGIAVTPGEGFGNAGRGYVRLSSLAPRPDIETAAALFPEILRPLS